jgi:hypothetical protein
MSMILSGIEERLAEYLRHWHALRILLPKKEEAEAMRALDIKWETVAQFVSPDILELIFMIEAGEGSYYANSTKSAILRRVSVILEGILTKPEKAIKLSEARLWVHENIPLPDSIEVAYDDYIRATWNDWEASRAQEIKDKVI